MKGAVMRRVLVPADFSEAALLVTREALSWVDAIDGNSSYSMAFPIFSYAGLISWPSALSISRD
jgi:hypothetical protein